MPVEHGWLERLARAAHGRALVLREIARRWETRLPRVTATLRAWFYPLALVLVGYMGYQAARDADLSEVHYWALAAAYVAALAWWLALALGWAALVSDGPARPAVASWCRTQVARYLPGGVWHVLARATTVQGRIRDKLTAVTAENVIVLLTALAVGGAWAAVHDWRWALLVLLLAAPLLASTWLERRTRITRQQVRRSAGSYALGYVAYGGMGMLVQIGVSGVRDPAHLLYVAGAACVAWAVGLVVVFAPSGVGVREVVYIWMLHGLYPTQELTEAAVTSRVVTVAAELTILALATRPTGGWSRSSIPASGGNSS